MSGKIFDLNIEQILENWEVRHAIREVIANALDEQLLTGTGQVKIEKRDDAWYVRDFGRGVKYTHLTQNENDEKLESPNVIGRFGIGLKDALATFERQGVEVQITSKFGTIRTTKSVKHGFGDIITLHAIIEEPDDTEFVGTEFKMIGVEEAEMVAAKQLFLIFSNEQVHDTTRYGQVISRQSGPGAIYINGVKVAEEPNFLFSYNVTLLNAAIKKAINRERSHVGRTAYADSVKKILLASSNKEVAEQLSVDIGNFHQGNMHDELAWVDVQEHAVKILSTQGNILMVTAEEAMRHPDLMDQARNSGMRILTIPENLRAKIADGVDHNGAPLVDLTNFSESYNDSFVFDFVQPSELSGHEKVTFASIPFIVDAFGGKPSNVEHIKISNTMRPDLMSRNQTIGCWDPSTNSIVISRDQLKSFSNTAGTLLHELVHAKTGFSDVTRDFETALTGVIGDLCNALRRSIDDAKEQRKHLLVAEPTTPYPVLTEQLQSATDRIKQLSSEKSLLGIRLDDAQKMLIQAQENEKIRVLGLAAELKSAQETIAQHLSSGGDQLDSQKLSVDLHRALSAVKLIHEEKVSLESRLENSMLTLSRLLDSEKAQKAKVISLQDELKKHQGETAKSASSASPSSDGLKETSPENDELKSQNALLNSQLNKSYDTFIKLRESEKLEKLRSGHLSIELKKAQDALAEVRSSEVLGTKKAWFKFW